MVIFISTKGRMLSPKNCNFFYIPHSRVFGISLALRFDGVSFVTVSHTVGVCKNELRELHYPAGRTSDA
jgi:hypothetical protein